MNTSRQLAELHKTHPVLFLLAHDQEIDINWQSTYAQVAREKALSGRFLVTTDPDVVKVGLDRLFLVGNNILSGGFSFT